MMKHYIEQQFDELIAAVSAMKQQAAAIEKNRAALRSISSRRRQDHLLRQRRLSGAITASCGRARRGRYKLERPTMNALSLTVDTSTPTSIRNDYSYDAAFERQLEDVVRKGDVLIGLSTSGNSTNMLRAFGKAHEMGIPCTALVDRKSGQMLAQADLAIAASADSSTHIQELHITIGHLICDLIEKEFYGHD